MLKPISVLAIDQPAAAIAIAVQKRLNDSVGVPDLMQVRVLTGGAGGYATDASSAPGTADSVRLPPLSALADAVESIRERWQAPDSPLRNRDDINNREVVLIALSAAGPARTVLLELARQIRQLYQMRMARDFYTVEALCLLPDLFSATKAEDYGAAYSLLRTTSAAMSMTGEESGQKPLDAVWLVSSTNAKRVKFGRIEQSIDPYVEAIAGAFSFEPEMSGALGGAFRPRGVDATFSSFGYSELYFPRDVAARRMEACLAAELVRDRLLAGDHDFSADLPQIWAKDFVVQEEFSLALRRIQESGDSVWKDFRTKNTVTEQTRSAEEVIVGVANDEKLFRETQQIKVLEALAVQSERATKEFGELLSSTVDAKIDERSYQASIRFLEALLNRTPELQPNAPPGMQNLETRIVDATRLLDKFLKFTPDETESDALRKRYRDLEALLADQKLTSDGLAALGEDDAEMSDLRAELQKAAEAREKELSDMRRELNDTRVKLDPAIFREEGQNSIRRNAAIAAKLEELAAETEAQQERLRTLFAEKPKAEQAWQDAAEERDGFFKRHGLRAGFGVFMVLAVPFIGYLVEIPLLRNIAAWMNANRGRTALAIVVGLAVYGIYVAVRYMKDIAPALKKAWDWLQRLKRDMNSDALGRAVNAKLRFEYDVAQRRTTIAVLKRLRETGRKTLDELRARVPQIEALRDAFSARRDAAAIPHAGLSVSVIDDADVDAFYEQTRKDRQTVFNDFFEMCLSRSQSRHLPIETVRQSVETYASKAFEWFRGLTLPEVVAGPTKIADEATISRRLKRLAEFSAPLIEIRDDDIPVQEAMQRDTTLWVSDSVPAFVVLLRNRFPDAQIKPSRDPLSAHALTRILHFPGYAIAQIEYYRAQYDPARYMESAEDPDLLPTELVLSGPLRELYEQLLLGQATGVIRVRDDGQLSRASTDIVLGDSYLAAAQHLASSGSETLRQDLESEIAPRLMILEDVERGLRDLLTNSPLTSFDRNLVGALIRRYSSPL